jgi:hypothetical protein
VYAFADQLSKMEELRSSKVVRGTQDGLYVNRTYYGLYAMLNELKAVVETKKPEWLRAGYVAGYRRCITNGTQAEMTHSNS